MSVMNFQSTLRDIKPPDKGSFPLDHDGERLKGVVRLFTEYLL